MQRLVYGFHLWVDTQRTAYFFPLAATLTLSVGVYLHFTHLIVGREVFLDHVLTPAFDVWLAVPMTYAAAAGWMSLKRARFTGLGQRAGYLLMIFYFSISIPIHAQTLVTGRIDYLIRAFPEGFSLIILPVMFVMIIFIQRLRFEAPARSAVAEPYLSSRSAGSAKR